MRNHAEPSDRFGHRYQPAGEFAVRTPLLPLSTIRAIYETKDPQEAWARAEVLLEHALIQDALSLSSPDLLAAPRNQVRTQLALIRFLARMSTRATPYGLFASLSVGSVGEARKFEFAPPKHCQGRTRPDLSTLHEIACHVTDRGEATLELNPNAYRRNDYGPGSLVVFSETPGVHRNEFEQAVFEIDSPLRTIPDALSQGARRRRLLEAYTTTPARPTSRLPRRSSKRSMRSTPVASARVKDATKRS